MCTLEHRDVVEMGNCLIGGKGIVATLQHACSEAMHGRLRLEVEILGHGVGLPAAQEADGICVDVAVKEGHGAAGVTRKMKQNNKESGPLYRG